MGKTKIRYGWGFILLKMLKYGTAGDLIYWKDEKVNFENLFHGKGPKNVRLGIYIKKKTKIRYGCKFISLKMLK